MSDITGTLTASLRRTVDALVAAGERAPKGALACLDVPALGFRETACAGIARADGTPLTADCAFHVASVGKLVTATLVLQAAEEGRLGSTGIDTSLGQLGVLDDALLDWLHVARGVSLGRAITVRQLLTHTAGLGDAFADGAAGTAEQLGGPAPDALAPAFWRALKARRDGNIEHGDIASRQWPAWDATRPKDPDAGLLNRYLAQLGRSPVAMPGERFHYSDQGFVLLALLCERVFGAPYATLQRTRILEPLGMRDSWMHAREPVPAHMTARECDVWMNGVAVLAAGANLSFDFGGGGQVFTAADLLRFFDALLAGRLFARTETRAAMRHMTMPPGMTAPRVGIGLALQFWAMPEGGPPMCGHSGAWGTHLWRDERTGATVVGTVNQRGDGAWAFALLHEVHDLLARDGRRKR